MLGRWVELGLPASEFWAQTPRQILMIFEAQVRRRVREHDERMHHAWHVAALVRLGVASLLDPKGHEFPPLDRLLSTAQEARRPKTDDELRELFIEWLGPPPPKSES